MYKKLLNKLLVIISSICGFSFLSGVFKKNVQCEKVILHKHFRFSVIFLWVFPARLKSIE